MIHQILVIGGIEAIHKTENVAENKRSKGMW